MLHDFFQMLAYLYSYKEAVLCVTWSLTMKLGFLAAGQLKKKKDTVVFRIFSKINIDIFSTRIMNQLSVLVLLFGFFAGKFHYTHGRIQKNSVVGGDSDVCVCVQGRIQYFWKGGSYV